MVSPNKFAILLLASALLAPLAAVGASPYSEHHDEFTGNRWFTSKELGDIGFGFAVLGKEAEIELVLSVPANGERAYALSAEVLSIESNHVTGEGSLMVKLGDEISTFSASSVRHSARRKGDHIYSVFELMYPLPNDFVARMAEGDLVTVRITGSAFSPTIEIKKKGMKRLREFVAAVQDK